MPLHWLPPHPRCLQGRSTSLLPATTWDMSHRLVQACTLWNTCPWPGLYLLAMLRSGLSGEDLCRVISMTGACVCKQDLTAHPDVEDLCKTAGACGTGAFPERLKQHVQGRAPAAYRAQGSGWSTPTSLQALLQQLKDCKVTCTPAEAASCSSQ